MKREDIFLHSLVFTRQMLGNKSRKIGKCLEDYFDQFQI